MHSLGDLIDIHLVSKEKCNKCGKRCETQDEFGEWVPCHPKDAETKHNKT